VLSGDKPRFGSSVWSVGPYLLFGNVGVYCALPLGPYHKTKAFYGMTVSYEYKQFRTKWILKDTWRLMS